jgi:hypothetical protein
MESLINSEETKQIVDLVNSFCIQKLDEEYLTLSERLIKKIYTQDPNAFNRGKIEVWAGAIVYAIGSINFLFDKETQPYASATDFEDFFKAKKSSIANKARQIKEKFELYHFCNEFTTKHINSMNPFNDVVMVDGMMVPLTELPEHIQEMVKEARARGEDLQFKTA